MLNDIREPKAGLLFMRIFEFCFVFLWYVGCVFMWADNRSILLFDLHSQMQWNAKKSEYQLLFCISLGDESVDFSMITFEIWMRIHECTAAIVYRVGG